MDRPLQHNETKATLFKKFDCLDLFPYSIAAITIAACIYILEAFVLYARDLNH